METVLAYIGLAAIGFAIGYFGAKFVFWLITRKRE